MIQNNDLDGKQFRPVTNSSGGRVTTDSLFCFSQSGPNFSAVYSGVGAQDGHLIGRVTGPDQAALIYHSRAADGSLDAGEAVAEFSKTDNGSLIIDMKWRWLNGTAASGTSRYEEVSNDGISRS